MSYKFNSYLSKGLQRNHPGTNKKIRIQTISYRRKPIKGTRDKDSVAGLRVSLNCQINGPNYLMMLLKCTK